MKHNLIYLIYILMIVLCPTEAKGINNLLHDDIPPISEPTIVYENGRDTNDNRDNTFPFSLHLDIHNNSLIITYDQERPADLDLTNVNGTTISHQSISGSGIYSMSLPSVSGTLYLFMTTPTLCAYVTISIF